MSPAPPAVGASASLSGVSGLLGIPSGLINIMDFNSSATRLPPLTGPDKVGVHHFTIEHDLGFRFFPPAVCTNTNASLPRLHEIYGEDGVSFINETCSGLRHIPVSVFYPTCENLQEPQNKTAPVFTQSLLETITAQVFGDFDSMRMHNLESQAYLDASICPDKYSMIILSPPVGGQRQAYTQLASDIASQHHVVVTVDHMFQSGAIEVASGDLFNLAGELVKPREANYGRVIDLMAVALHFNESSNLDTLLWTAGTEIDLGNTYVFGHGQGGLVARMMVASNLLSGGGTLDNLIRMPAPYNESNIMYKPRHKGSRATNPGPQPQPALQPKPMPGVGDDDGDRLGAAPGGLGDSLRERLKNMARGLTKTLMDSLSSLLCRILGTCSTLVQKRDFDSASYDHEISHSHQDDICNDYCLYDCKLDCKPDVPHGLFPDNLGQSAGKTRPDDGDWSEEWKEYRDSIGDYKGFPGRDPHRQHEKSCYDDDYCHYKCCSKAHIHETDDDWEDEHESHRHHHEDQENDWDQQDGGRVPHRGWNEDDSPSSRPKGGLSSPGADEGINPPDDSDRSQDDDDDSKDEDDSNNDEGDSENDEDDSKDDEDQSNDDEDDSNDDDDSKEDEDDSNDDKDDSEDDEDDSRDDEDDSEDDEDDSNDDEDDSKDDEDGDDNSEGNEDGSQDENSENEL